jgi:2-C-methyl-D-erythritol 4-phosphate cytidylyltransferase
MFRLHTLQQALQAALEQNIAITDDASAIEHHGLSPRLIEGNANNIKITQASDLALAEFFLSQRGK